MQSWADVVGDALKDESPRSMIDRQRITAIARTRARNRKTPTLTESIKRTIRIQQQRELKKEMDAKRIAFRSQKATNAARSPLGYRTSRGPKESKEAYLRLHKASRLENQRHLDYAAMDKRYGPIWNPRYAGKGPVKYTAPVQRKKAPFVTDFNYNKLNASYWARKNFPRTMFVADVADIGYKGANVASKALFGVSAGTMAAGLGIATVGAGLLYEHFTGGNAIQDAGTGIGQAQGFFDNMEQSYRRSRFSRSRFQESTQGLVFGLHNAR